MGKSLDFSVYEDGYDVDAIDCILNPIAAACGYFERDYYFYACFLSSIYGLMEISPTDNIVTFVNKMSNSLGIEFRRIDVTNMESESTIKRIAEEICLDHPVILITKYNSLFFNPYYHNEQFKAAHGIVVNEYNSDVNTFAIKDCTIVKGQINSINNQNIHFQLHITDTMLAEIINKSNRQFIDEKSQYANSIYCLVANNNFSFNPFDVIRKAINVLEDGKDALVEIIQDDNKLEKFENNEYNRQRFCGSFKAILGLLHKEKLFNNGKSNSDLTDLEKRLCENRNRILKKMFLTSVRKKKIPNDLKAEFCQTILDDNKLLQTYLISIMDKSNEQIRMHYYVDLKKYYNNKAFEQAIIDNSTADITGEGTHFLNTGIITNQVWDKGTSSFYYGVDNNIKDNISCMGQDITLVPVKNVTGIEVLGCSEYGSYSETCRILFENDEEYEFKIDLSDFFQSAIYGEKLFWSGTALNRKNGLTKPHSFSARLFAKYYDIPRGDIKKIILPDKKNMHIFAISLFYSEH